MFFLDLKDYNRFYIKKFHNAKSVLSVINHWITCGVEENRIVRQPFGFSLPQIIAFETFRTAWGKG